MINDKDLFNTLDQMFSDQHLKHSRSMLKKKGAESPKKDLEVALAVLLVDLASCDQVFNPKEYNVISLGLRRLFGCTKEQVTALVNQATQIISGLRGTQQFAEVLRDSLSAEDKQIILEIIDEIILADGKEDGFEIFLREKFKSVLGISNS